MDHIVRITPANGGGESVFLFESKEKAMQKMKESEEWNKDFPEQKCKAVLEYNGKVIKEIE